MAAMIKPPGIVLVVLLIMLVIAVVSLLLMPIHVQTHLPLQVRGRLVSAEDGVPVAGAWVMAVPSRAWAEDEDRLADASRSSRTWIALQHSERYVPPGPASAPARAGGGTTRSDGSFDANLLCIWSEWRRGFILSRVERSPRDRVRALAIEIKGRDPVILDVPEGTWTEHPDEDDLWASWDLGVIEVPSTP